MEHKTRTLLIEADYNDADIARNIIVISEEDFQKFLPLMKAINEFKPYIGKFGGVRYHNWKSNHYREGDKTPYLIYNQFPKELIDEFDEEVMGQLVNPEECYGAVFHTIVNIQEVVLGEQFVNGNHRQIEARNKNIIDDYYKEYQKIYSYRRASDGKSLNCIPFSEMTEEENQLLEKSRNLWIQYADKDYIDYILEGKHIEASDAEREE